MKTRIRIIAATLTLLIAGSLAAWPQQKQGQKERMASTETASPNSQTSPVIGKAAMRTTRNTDHDNKANARGTDSIDVVGHLGFEGAVISNIRTTEDQTRPLLEVTDKTSHTLNLVDVADPSHPKIVERVRKPADLQNSRLEVAVGDAALFAETQDTSPSRRSVTIVNFADRGGPRTVRRFENVTALWTDRRRGFIYLANPEGLWILQPQSLADRIAFQKQADEMFRDAQTP